MQWINEKWNHIKKWIRNNGLENREESLILLWSCFQSICLQIIYIASSFSIWMSLESILLPVLQRVTDSTISKLHMEWVICATLLVTLLFFIYFVKKVINKCRVSKWFLSNLILISLIYTRYRNYSDEFVFWGCNKFYYLDLLYAILIVLLVYSFFTYIIPLLISLCIGKRDKENYLLRDDEIDDPDKDLLGYDKQVQNLSHLLETVDVRKRAYSVGIVGEWGIGKSSFLKLFSKHITEQGDIVIRFNPRHAKSTSFIQEDFFNQLRAELGKYSGNIGTRIDKYAYALQLTTPTKWFYAIWDLFTNWTADIEKQRINEVMRSLNRYIYIFIEDLDRLTGAEILEVLKLIDANGNFCNTFFLTAYDKNYVNGILKRTLKLDNDSTDYTDKYFNYEYILDKPQKNNLLKVLIKEVLDWVKIESPEDNTSNDLTWSILFPVLLNNLPTIRQIKRYINLLRSSYIKTKNNVVFRDYALMMLIKFLDKDAYWDIYRQKFTTNRGKFVENPYYSLVEGVQSKADKYNRISNFSYILHLLFDTKGINQFQCMKQICRVESFENYFYERIEGKLYPVQINQLLSLDINTKSAIDQIEQLISSNKNNISSIEEFFSWGIPENINNIVILRRYISLLFYASVRINSLNMNINANHILTKDTLNEIVKSLKIDNQVYIENVSSAISQIVEYIPYGIGIYAIRRINTMKANDIVLENVCDTIDQNVELALLAQEKYDSFHGTANWEAFESLQLAQISAALNNVLVDKAQAQIDKMMSLYPDEYASSLLILEDRNDVKSNKCTYISINEYDRLRSICGGTDKFVHWVNKINSDDLKYIYQTLHQVAVKNNYANALIPYVASLDYENFALIAEKLRSRDAEI